MWIFTFQRWWSTFSCTTTSYDNKNRLEYEEICEKKIEPAHERPQTYYDEKIPIPRDEVGSVSFHIEFFWSLVSEGSWFLDSDLSNIVTHVQNLYEPLLNAWENIIEASLVFRRNTEFNKNLQWCILNPVIHLCRDFFRKKLTAKCR